MKTLKAILIAAFAFVLTTPLGMAAARYNFRADLTGKGEVPAVMTKAKGEVDFMMGKDGKELTYILKLKNIEDVTAAHIHAGKKGEEGVPVAGLFAGPKKEGKFSGVLAKGTITDKDLVGPLAGKTIDDLVKMIKDGDTYVNVHTTRVPAGEIRGEIEGKRW